MYSVPIIHLAGGNKTRLACARAENMMIQWITDGAAWISCGDRNLIPGPDDTGEYRRETVYDELTRVGKDARSQVHSGRIGTWIGFSYDTYKCPIVNGKLAEGIPLDVIVSSLGSICSFTDHCAYDPISGDLVGVLGPNHDVDRNFASDHSLIGSLLVV